MILGSPPCAYLGSVTILKTMTGHHSVFLYVFSQQTDKVLCSSRPQHCWACGTGERAVEDVTVPQIDPKVLTLLQGHGAVSFHAGFWRMWWNVLLWMTCLCEFRCAFPFSTCFWLQIAHICHLLLWLFFLRRHSALPTAKCSFRETSHEKHEKLRTVTDSCHWCCTSDIFSAEFHVYEFGIHLTAAGTKSPASSSPAI